jgi:archaellum component FlaC
MVLLVPLFLLLVGCNTKNYGDPPQGIRQDFYNAAVDTVNKIEDSFINDREISDGIKNKIDRLGKYKDETIEESKVFNEISTLQFTVDLYYRLSKHETTGDIAKSIKDCADQFNKVKQMLNMNK